MLPLVLNRQAVAETPKRLCDQGVDHDDLSGTVTNVIVVRRGMRPERLEALAARHIDAGGGLVVQGRKARAKKLLSGLAESRPPFAFFRRDGVWTLIYTRASQHPLAWSQPGR